MKKSTIFLFLLLCFAFNSCETPDTGQTDIQDFVSGNPDELLVKIQIDFPRFIQEIENFGAELTRIEYYYNDYDNVYHLFWERRNDTIWNIAYSDLFPDMDEALIIAESQGKMNHVGVIKVLKAFTLTTLVDFYGEVPFTEIGSPDPNVDDGQLIYNGVFSLLDEAISAFGEGGADLENDYYYNNDFTKWIKLANTIKMNALLNTRLVDPGAMTAFDAIVSSGDFISNTGDDFEFNYGNAKTKHPDYDVDHNMAGGGRYRSNWLMNEMLNTDDPRRRYYFYRQHPCTPGNTNSSGQSCQAEEHMLFCSIVARPGHYPSEMVFCSVSHGYWGRDHGYQIGIPPDTFRRTIVGVYPVGGRFDDDQFLSTGTNVGGLGFGITPMMLASWVDFMRAEMAMVSGNNGAAIDFIQLGMQKSIDKTMSFISLDAGADITFEPTSTDVSNFMTAISNNFNNGDSDVKWNILAEQQFISQYGNGINAYNLYRRTGFPKTLQFHISHVPGPLVRSLLYPTSVVDDNMNITQKPGGDVQVFWDINPAYPAFPFAN